MALQLWPIAQEDWELPLPHSALWTRAFSSAFGDRLGKTIDHETLSDWAGRAYLDNADRDPADVANEWKNDPPGLFPDDFRK